MNRDRIISFIALLLFGGLIYIASLKANPEYNEVAGFGGKLPELEYLKDKDFDFKELSNYFTDLSEKKGAKYAYAVLRVAPIPPNTDLHLLGHIVGDILYKQEGAQGIKVCTQDFRNACSHSIVVGLLLEKGEAALPEISDACREAPGGSGAYGMCFHGLGHGILAYLDYDMAKAAALCKKTGTPEYHNREYIECVGGTVMEIIGGGFHNRTLWEAQSKKFLTADDPLLPCTADYMPEEAKQQCYMYLTPRLFKMAGADLQRPTPKDYEKAFTFCDKVPKTETADRRSCYGGFGKEFIVLVQERDIRKIDLMTKDQMKTVHEWCALAKDSDGVEDCMNSAAASMYWGGENDESAVISFCEIAPQGELKDSCFGNLIGAVSVYMRDASYRRNFCTQLPDDYREECEARLIARP